MTDDSSPKTYTPLEAAQRLNVTAYHVRRLIHEGHIRVIRFSTYGRMHIPIEEIERITKPRKL